MDRERNCNDLKEETETRVKSLVNGHKAKVSDYIVVVLVIQGPYVS